MYQSFQFWPGDMALNAIITTVLYIAAELSIFALCLICLRFYIPGRTQPTRILAKLLGIMTGIFAGRYYTITFIHSFPQMEPHAGLVLILFVVLNTAVVAALFGGNTDSGNRTDNHVNDHPTGGSTNGKSPP